MMKNFVNRSTMCIILVFVGKYYFGFRDFNLEERSICHCVFINAYSLCQMATYCRPPKEHLDCGS